VTRALAIRANAAVAATRARTLRAAKAAWTSVPDYSDDGLAAWLDSIIPLLMAGQQTIATLTDIYIAAELSELSQEVVQAVGIPAEMASGAALRNGVPPEVEYERPFREIWYQLSQDKDFADAVRLGEQRAMTMISTDLQLARTHSARYALSQSGPGLGVVGYRRVLGSGHSCELCQIASTQRYHIADLMPIHANCSCGVAPILGDKDPGQRIDSAYLSEDATASDTSGKFAPYFGTHILEVRQHGELGPVLTVRDQAFRGPSDIPSAAETAA
jgi:hypothetical protein